MRVFVTGAFGHVGPAVGPELLEAGHQVVGPARSDKSAAASAAAGAEVRRGGLDDRTGPREALTEADALDAGPRIDAENAVVALAERGIRSSAARLTPTVHSTLDRNGFIPAFIPIARSKGVPSARSPRASAAG
ncbi:NAD-dependent epimerase/dehydratase family protein [Streptomyces sp. NPDC001056]